MVAKDNMFNYGSGAYLVKGGSVATIEYMNSTTNAPIVIKNLSDPMLILLPRQSSDVRPAYPREMTSEELYSHKIEMLQNDSALHIAVYPDNCNYGFNVYVKKDQFPTEQDSDYNYTLPHEDRWDFASNCSKDSNNSKAFEIFMSSKLFNYTAAGFYYVGIKPYARNGSGIVNYLPANYTTQMYTSMCMYWDEANETWSTSGCEVS